MTVGKVWFSFNGRVGRRDYLLKGLLPWWVTLGLSLGVHTLVTTGIDSMGGFLIRDIVWGAFLVGMVISYAGAASKRWHDLGKSAKWNLGLLFPLNFLVYSFVLGMRRGQAEHNRYGPPPDSVGPKH